MSEGIYFTKFSVLGPNKIPAELNLTNGLNVIWGPSDTGKSYILDCLNYLLGGKDEPKKIDEAKGYKYIQAEVRTFSGKIFTISREFGQGIIDAAECPFQEFEKNPNKMKFSAKHSEFTDNLSLYLLTLLELNGKKIKVNMWNDLRNLSFRNLCRFCLIKEDRIITRASPIFDGLPQDDTENKSLFKLFLTGTDDSDLPTSNNPEQGKSRIKGKIDLIQAQIDSKKKELSNLRKTTQQLTSEEVNVQIQKLLTIIEDTYKEIKQQEVLREKIYNDLSHLEAILLQNEEIKKRFGLLNNAYSSDLGRLAFINEGKFGLDQIKTVNCPLCEAEIEPKMLEPHDEMGQTLLHSIKAEYSKISSKQKDLIKAIIDIEGKISLTKSSIASKTEEFRQIDKYIADKLKPVHQTSSENLNAYLRLRSEKAKADVIDAQIIDLTSDLAKFTQMLEETPERPPEAKI